jgi:hypothetical protein
VIHTYAVARAPVPVPPVPGIDGEKLRAVGVDDLAAIVSDHAQHPRPTGPRLVEHERVVQALLPHGVVPVRYGHTLPERAALESMLATRAGQLHRLLDRVCGRLEMGVRIALPPAGTQMATTGRAWLLGKLDRQRTAARLVENLDRALGSLAVDRKLLAARDDLRVAYLVEAHRVEEFRGRVGTLPGIPAAEMVCTGPWPAYSFMMEDQP